MKTCSFYFDWIKDMFLNIYENWTFSFSTLFQYMFSLHFARSCSQKPISIKKGFILYGKNLWDFSSYSSKHTLNFCFCLTSNRKPLPKHDLISALSESWRDLRKKTRKRTRNFKYSINGNRNSFFCSEIFLIKKIYDPIFFSCRYFYSFLFI